MSDPRLKSKLLVQAGARLCSQRAVPAMVTRRGDPDAGAVYI
jgi:GMP synthase (glutamine-hydrolysing)